MGNVVYKIGASRKKQQIVTPRLGGAKMGFSIIMTAKPPIVTPSQSVQPAKILKKTVKHPMSFKVTGGVLSYDLQFKYELNKYSYGIGADQWFPKGGWVTYGAGNYKGPKTHYLDIEIVFSGIKNVGGKEDMPCVGFSLNQWYGPLVGVGTTAKTKGWLMMGNGKVNVGKSRW